MMLNKLENLQYYFLQVLECAKRGYHSVGVELNLPLVIFSKLSAQRKGLSSHAHFYRRNILKTNLHDYPTAVLFGAETIVSKMMHCIII